MNATEVESRAERRLVAPVTHRPAVPVLLFCRSRPPLLPGLEARLVPQTDPRVALRGQLGLYVRDGFQIEAGTVLGAVKKTYGNI